MEKIFEKIKESGIVPVVAIEDEKDAVKLAEALRKGGLNLAEITFRTPAAKAAIEKITEAFPDMLVGAGTVLTTEQVDEAVNAGAKFIVSPGINPNVVKYCISQNVPIIPGVCNPTNVETALELGLNVVKFFPAEAAGGLNYIKAIAAPYGNVMFMPTGGINKENVADYLKYKRILACGGSFMVKSSLISEGKFDEIERLTREAVDIVEEAGKE